MNDVGFSPRLLSPVSGLVTLVRDASSSFLASVIAAPATEAQSQVHAQTRALASTPSIVHTVSDATVADRAASGSGSLLVAEPLPVVPSASASSNSAVGLHPADQKLSTAMMPFRSHGLRVASVAATAAAVLAGVRRRAATSLTRQLHPLLVMPSAAAAAAVAAASSSSSSLALVARAVAGPALYTPVPAVAFASLPYRRAAATMPFGVSSRFSSSSAPTLMPQPSSSLTLTMPTRSFFGQANNRSVSFPSAINPQPQSRAQDGTAANGSRLDGFLDRFKYQEQGSGRSTKSATSDGGEPGTHDAPIVVEVAQGSFKSQLFSLARQLIMVTVLMAYLSTMLEERTGMSKSMNQHNEVQPDTNSDCRFADVAGVDEAKEELTEIVEYLKDPEKFQRLGGRLPKGVLLYGPPGTGKTLLAKAISNEAKASFFYASGSEFDELFVGVGSKRIRELFAQAKRKSPAIIFIDEIDAIGASRTTRDQQFSKMTLNQLLIEMDGFKQNDGVIVIAATNFPELLDKALVRPGRFDRHVTVPLPDVLGRKQILDVHTKDIPVAKNVDLSIIARGTPGFSGAELAEVVNQAALKASVEGDKVVTMAHLEYAKDKIIMGAERKSAVIDDSVRKITAYHEGGHALVALMSHGAHPVHKATIMPRGRALGMVAQLPEKDEISTTRRQLLARLEVCMGGRVAEELIFGHDNITSGASSDIASATSLARAMVTQYGMSEKIGPVLHREEDMDKLSPETLAVIESEVKALVETAYKNATQMLRTNSTELHRIAQALIEYETLNGEELKLIVQGKSIPRDPVTPKKQ